MNLQGGGYFEVNYLVQMQWKSSIVWKYNATGRTSAYVEYSMLILVQWMRQVDRMKEGLKLPLKFSWRSSG